MNAFGCQHLKMLRPRPFIGALLIVLGACSGEQKPSAPSEQELHAQDGSGRGGTRGRHLFSCDDGRIIFVDYKDQGLALEIREQESGAPLIFTAPSQGLQFVGDGATATIITGGLRLDPAKGKTRLCKRETR